MQWHKRPRHSREGGNPCLAHPAPLMTSEPGSFARKTIVERKPQIIDQVIEDNDYAPDVVAELETFKHEIATQPMRPLGEDAPGVASWNRELAA